MPILKDFAAKRLFDKLPANVKRTDKQIARARMLDKETAGRRQEFLEPPLMSQLMNMLFGSQKVFNYHQAVLKSDEMYYNDAATHNAIMRNVFKATQSNRNKRPFELALNIEDEREKDQVLEAIEKIFVSKGVRIYKRAKHFARNVLMEGQVFYRVIIDGDEVVELRKIKGPRSGFRIEGPVADEQNRLFYLQRELSSAKPVNIFYDWEVIPFYWNYDDERETGTPMPVAARKAFGREDKGADALKTARFSRAWTKLLFEYENTTRDKFEEAVAAYKQSRKDVRLQDEPFSDIHTMGKVKTLDMSSPALHQINDLLYHKFDKMHGLFLPGPFYDGERERYPNRAVLDVYYDEWVASMIAAIEEAITGDYEDSGILMLIDLQLVLMERRWWNTPVTLEWPSKKRLVAEESQAIDETYDRGILSDPTYLMMKHNINAEDEVFRMLSYQKMRKEILGDAETQKLAQDRKQRKNGRLTNDKGEADEDEVQNEEFVLRNGHGFYTEL